MSARDRTLNALAEQLLVPLACGGPLRPIAPIGARRAIAITEEPFALEGEGAERLRSARLSVARGLFPIDDLADPEKSEWLLGCALNDFLQVTNPSLAGSFGRGNAARLLGMVRQVIDAAGPPRTLGDALARHTTFSRLLELTRIDTFVSFWAGSRSFVGARPPRRLLAWPRLRRVSEHEETYVMIDMAKEAAWAGDFSATLNSFLAASPLTDLANLRRKSPAFSWSGGALALIRNRVGRSLAARAIDRGGDVERAVEVLHALRVEVEDDDQKPVGELIETLRARSGLAARN